MLDSTLSQQADDDGGEVLQEAFLLYRDAGLRLPPVPRALASALEQHGDWRFGSTDADLTDRAGFLAAAADADAGPEVGFGHLGHGIASWHLCYRLLLDPLAVFVRLRFGGAAGDEDDGNVEGTRSVNETATYLEELVALAGTAKARGILPAGGRLILVLDDRDGDFWQIGPDGRRNPGEHVLADALSYLAEREIA